MRHRQIRQQISFVSAFFPAFSRAAFLVAFIAGFFAALTAADSNANATVSYNRDVRPILSENCFNCHGADKAKRKGDLGLTSSKDAQALNKESSRHAIVPGDLKKSELITRIITSDVDDVMPPPKSDKKLTPAQIDLLQRWVAQGAEYEPHWSYAAIRDVPAPTITPTITAKNWAFNDVDRFILARLEKEGLPPSPEADRPTLIRRLSLDLTGLPPTPAEVTAFVADRSATAYETLVDRLLASPRYGERMGVFWLDLVRYADSIGYHSDNERNVSPFRDYVIKAFNTNLPFDRFTTEQIAGDLLPNPTLSQRVASAYNRLIMTTEEGGAQAKEYEAKNLGDRVRNVAGAWLGSTLGCAECHDHKFDPFSARDYYTMGAFFADVKENAIGRREDEITVTKDEQREQIPRIDAAIAEQQKLIDTDTPALQQAQKSWESIATTATVWSDLTTKQATSKKGTVLTVQKDNSLLASKPADKDTFTISGTSALKRITGLRLETLTDPSLPKSGPGTADNGNFVLSEVTLAISEKGSDKNGERAITVTSAASDHAQNDYPIAATLDHQGNTGWAIQPQEGKPHTALFSITAVDLPKGATVVVTLSFNSSNGRHLIGRARLSLTGDSDPLRDLNMPADIRAALAVAAATRSAEQRAKIAAHFRTIAPSLAENRSKVAALRQERQDLDQGSAKCLTTISVNPRTVRVLPRGNWQDDSGDVVQPAVPHFLRQITSTGARATRLDLANWLIAQDNPLTARVFVNRVWRMFFGTGLSKSVDDFGLQGEWPVHPELLEFLAGHFRTKWDVKALVRMMVTSHVYRLSATPEKAQRVILAERDPFGRLLSHQAMFRLDAEFVRDNALAISGLLVEKIGGPSVKPYQPAGYWRHLNFPEREWANDQGKNAYRRGLYTWWQRTFLQPSLLAFDAPAREECTGERTRANTPQQALALLNDPTYVEAARAFAVRIITEGGADDRARIAWAWSCALARQPTAAEQTVVNQLLAKHRRAPTNPAEATALFEVGLFRAPSSITPADMMGWISVARTILNLHETITRN
jgi:mono/diheme cytochrome c family protein